MLSRIYVSKLDSDLHSKSLDQRLGEYKELAKFVDLGKISNGYILPFKGDYIIGDIGIRITYAPLDDHLLVSTEVSSYFSKLTRSNKIFSADEEKLAMDYCKKEAIKWVRQSTYQVNLNGLRCTNDLCAIKDDEGNVKCTVPFGNGFLLTREQRNFLKFRNMPYQAQLRVSRKMLKKGLNPKYLSLPAA